MSRPVVRGATALGRIQQNHRSSGSAGKLMSRWSKVLSFFGADQVVSGASRRDQPLCSRAAKVPPLAAIGIAEGTDAWFRWVRRRISRLGLRQLRASTSSGKGSKKNLRELGCLEYDQSGGQMAEHIASVASSSIPKVDATAFLARCNKAILSFAREPMEFRNRSRRRRLAVLACLDGVEALGFSPWLTLEATIDKGVHVGLLSDYVPAVPAGILS